MIRIILISVILIYRLIPNRIRRIWSFGDSTSHLVLAKIQASTESQMAILSYFLRCVKPKPHPDIPFPAGWDN